ncbi:MAG TPA: N-acetylmuramoyl-L-alanine amidase [Mycobacteriales bacterium]|nr:N-acetylmuramoyl-L-alanine amidase [Mycobacteriales bacterium]
MPGRPLLRSRLFARVAVVLSLLGAALVVASEAPVHAVTSHRPLNDTRAVVTTPVRVGFPVEYVGVVAELAPHTHLAESGRAPYGEVRFAVAGRWGAWQAFGQDGAQAAGTFTSALVSAEDADAYQVRGLPAAGRRWRVAALNTTDGPEVVVGHVRAAARAASGACLSRADWGADESLTAWSKGTDTPAFAPVQVLTVHHTAGSNDPAQDYAATVRAIYSYHVTTNGWSDIGYQYLVDGRGALYEGRSTGRTSTSCLSAGGDGSDFAHQPSTGHVVTGAHAAGYNSGNAGVALMGCYDATSACTGSTTAPTAAVDGLEQLLASLSTRHALDPQGTTHYVNPVSGVTKDVATISGHRDWEATACPGGTLYAQLPQIRADVKARTTGSAPAPAPAPAPAAITSASCSGKSCSFTGTGTGTLRWTFGNGRTASGASVSTTYGAAGTYAVTVTDGQPTSASRQVTCTTVRKQVRCST